MTTVFVEQPLALPGSPQYLNTKASYVLLYTENLNRLV